MESHRSDASTRLIPTIVLVIAAILTIAPAAAAAAPSPSDLGLTVVDSEGPGGDDVEAIWTDIWDTIEDTGLLGSPDWGGTPVPEIVDQVSGEDPKTPSAERTIVSDPVGSPAAFTQSPADAGVRSTAPVRSDAPTVGAASTESPTMAYAISLAAGIGFFLVPVAMYRRVKKSKALDNDVRNAIFKYVENNPGATITEIAEGVGVSHSTATYHIKILTEFDLISKRRDGNSLHIFPSDAGLGSKEALLLSYMRDRETREIIRSVHANPWTYPSELARSLDMSRSSAQWHLEKLEDSGIVNVVRDGKFSYLYIEPEMKDTVESHLVQ